MNVISTNSKYLPIPTGIRSRMDREESYLFHRIRDSYRRGMKVSIQLLNEVQTFGRPSPCNQGCNITVNEQSLQLVCDASDLVMKEIVVDRVLKNRRVDSFLYTCHKGLSNVIVPYWDSDIKSYWYVFLGQFRLDKYSGTKCSSCLRMADILPLTEVGLSEVQRRYVSAATPSKPKTPESDLADRFSLTELIICKTIVMERVRNFWRVGELEDLPSIQKWVSDQAKTANGSTQGLSRDPNDIADRIAQNAERFISKCGEETDFRLRLLRDFCNPKRDGFMRVFHEHIYEFMCLANAHFGDDGDLKQQGLDFTKVAAPVISEIACLSADDVYRRIEGKLDRIAECAWLGEELASASGKLLGVLHRSWSEIDKTRFVKETLGNRLPTLTIDNGESTSATKARVREYLEALSRLLS